MKIYIDHNTTILFENLWIPKDTSNRHYQQFLEEIKQGEACLIPPTETKINTTVNPVVEQNNAPIDINAAKEELKNKFREARKPLLEKLDIEFLRALETKDTTKQQQIVAKKQMLRQITEMRLPNDIEALKNIWPDILNSEKIA
jgi:hypothetical protein